MGWIYDGAGFVKANKEQRQAFDKYQRHELIREALAEPYTVPAMIGGVLFFAGAVSVAALATVLWGPFKKEITAAGDIPGEVVELIIHTLDEAGISEEEQSRFQSDLRNCIKAHPRYLKPSPVTALLPFYFGPVGAAAAVLPDPLRTPKIIRCMNSKGWATDMVIEAMVHMII